MVEAAVVLGGEVMNYYEREGYEHPVDRLTVFETPQDRVNEQDAVAFMEKEWDCRLLKFGRLTPVDRYILKDDHLQGVVEIKCRSHDFSQYPTVFLNLRKWLALTMGALGFGVPAFFIARWNDALGWVNLDDIDANTRNVRYMGCARKVKSDSDREPVILVPKTVFTMVYEPQPQPEQEPMFADIDFS